MHGVWHAFCSRGFTVFAVRHGNIGRWTMNDFIENLKSSVHFVRKNAQKYKILPDNLGVIGMSAGGQLALQLGYKTPEVAPYIDCLAVFCPVCDSSRLPDDYKSKLFQNSEQIEKIAGNYSSLHYVNSMEKYPATIFFHAKGDTVAPIEASQKVAEVLREGGNVVEYVTVDSDQHEWTGMHQSMSEAADWMLQQMTDIVNGTRLKHLARTDLAISELTFDMPSKVNCV